jgi:beta-lactamase class C
VSRFRPSYRLTASAEPPSQIRINGQTLFFNYGVADLAKNLVVTPDSIFNLASVGKLFAATLLAQSVTQGELRLDDPVAKFVPELAQGTDIRRVTLGQLASHTSGLPRVSQNYEERHKGKYTLPDFIRFLKSWKADVDHEPGRVRARKPRATSSAW